MCNICQQVHEKKSSNLVQVMELWSSTTCAIYGQLRSSSIQLGGKVAEFRQQAKGAWREQLACLVTHSHPFVPLLRSIQAQRERKGESFLTARTFTLEPFARPLPVCIWATQHFATKQHRLCISTLRQIPWHFLSRYSGSERVSCWVRREREWLDSGVRKEWGNCCSVSEGGGGAMYMYERDEHSHVPMGWENPLPAHQPPHPGGPAAAHLHHHRHNGYAARGMYAVDVSDSPAAITPMFSGRRRICTGAVRTCSAPPRGRDLKFYCLRFFFLSFLFFQMSSLLQYVILVE